METAVVKVKRRVLGDLAVNLSYRSSLTPDRKPSKQELMVFPTKQQGRLAVTPTNVVAGRKRSFSTVIGSTEMADPLASSRPRTIGSESDSEHTPVVTKTQNAAVSMPDLGKEMGSQSDDADTDTLGSTESDLEDEPSTTMAQNGSPGQIRLMANTLRARLSLAWYKIQTGQIHTPLEHLKLLPIPTNPEASGDAAMSTDEQTHEDHPAEALEPTTTFMPRESAVRHVLNLQEFSMPTQPEDTIPSSQITRVLEHDFLVAETDIASDEDDMDVHGQENDSDGKDSCVATPPQLSSPPESRKETPEDDPEDEEAELADTIARARASSELLGSQETA